MPATLNTPGVAAKRELGQAGECEQGQWAAARGSGHCSSRSPEGPRDQLSGNKESGSSPGETAGVVWPGLHRDGLDGDPLYLLPLWCWGWLWAGGASGMTHPSELKLPLDRGYWPSDWSKNGLRFEELSGKPPLLDRCPPRARLACPPAPPPGVPISAARTRAWGPGRHHTAGTPCQASDPRGIAGFLGKEPQPLK